MQRLKQILLDEVLPRVQKPGQYAGGERNTVVKEHSSVDLSVALAFPDTYAIGMSHLGLKILYHMLNSREDVTAERVFAPWVDMEEELRKRDLPLYTLETFTPLGDFDVIGFSMQYELCFTNALNMLELGGIPLETRARSSSDPVVIAGGSISLAMEPMTPFLDAILIGDAEDVLDTIIDTIIEWKRARTPRSRLHEALCRIPGVYVPSLYDIKFKTDGTIKSIANTEPAPEKVRKISVNDFENAPFPTHPVVPNTEVIHDRINIEIMRGCPHHCRFCQAVQRYRPLKLRSIPKIIQLCEETFRSTGYEEINLTSLSTSDYPGIKELISRVSADYDSRRVNISLPSLRVGEELQSIPAMASSVRKAGLTFAPEVGTDRLRETIGKPIKNDDLLKSCEAAFKAGYRLLKLYFLIGVPTETDGDIKAVVELADQSSLLRKKFAGGRRGAINASVSSHVPKPHTPFQWEAMNTRDELLAKQSLILAHKRSSSLRFKFHNVNESYLEAVFSRGDRRLAIALLKARERGLRLDGWSECFDIRAWEEVFKDSGIDPDFYALRKRSTNEILPWDMISAHTAKEHLLKEKDRFEEMI